MNKTMILLHSSFFLMVFFLWFNIKNHPIIIMIILLIYSLLICLNMSLWKSNFIFSIILFLMMISGLLIIFLYFSSLISNEQSALKLNFFIPILLIFNLTLFLSYSKSFTIIYKYKFNEINLMMKTNLSNFHNILNLYEYPLNNLTILSMFYLLISLFSIIKICSMKFFSMRKIN